jgi:hypothetical protein
MSLKIKVYYLSRKSGMNLNWFFQVRSLDFPPNMRVDLDETPTVTLF